MADTPEGAVALSDDEITAMVNELDGGETSSTEDPEPESTPPVDETDTAEDDAPDTSSDDEEGTEDEDGQPALAAPIPPSVPKGTPFRFTANGAEHTLPGATVTASGDVVIPSTALPDFQRTLASAKALETTFKQTKRDYDRKLSEAKAQRTVKDVESDAVIGLFSDIAKMSPEQRWDYFNRFDEEVPKLQVQVERQKLDMERQQLERDRKGPELSPEEVQEQRREIIMAELQRTRARIAPAVKALSPEEVDRVFARWGKNPERLVVRDGEQDVFDDTDLIDDFKFLIENKQKGNGAAARNAALNADRGNNPPPVVQPRAPTGQFKKAPKPKDHKEWKTQFMNDKLDDE